MTLALTVAAVALLLALLSTNAEADDAPWTVYITNDNCPDYTWGFTEEQTRQAFADIVRAHLDLMAADGHLPEDERDHYNMAVTQEALCFVELYPARKQELIDRIREGRICVSPFVCNSLWAMNSVEQALRVLYPARRLERDWGIPIDVAEHIEEPSQPWGMASLLSGAGIRWLINPFYAYDSTFAGLTNPPLFVWEGPDGTGLKTILDPWTCNRHGYVQGGRLIQKPEAVSEWLAHYSGLGGAYPLRSLLASGTHGDINPNSGSQAAGFAQSISGLNAAGGAVRYVNGTFRQFCEVVEAAQEARPFLPTVRGCFGHSWDLWPVSLALYVAQMREGERRFLAAESLVAAAMQASPTLAESTRADRERAEWLLAMLSDHAWNGTDPANKRQNADLRRRWAAELLGLGDRIAAAAWAGIRRDDGPGWCVFNPTSVPRRGLAPLPAEAEVPAGVTVQPDGDAGCLWAQTEALGGFAFGALAAAAPDTALSVTPTTLENATWRLSLNPATGGLSSLFHKPSGRELRQPGALDICQTLLRQGSDHALSGGGAEVAASGPLFVAARVAGTVGTAQVQTTVKLFAGQDWVEFRVRVHLPVQEAQMRLCQVFPVAPADAILRLETPGAVIRPYPQPRGDLLPGADTRRFAVQGFVDASSPQGPGVTVVPLDAYCLLLEKPGITFEALGNDQNYREVIQNQNGETDFVFRYVLRFHEGPYTGPEAFAWSRTVATPLLAAPGVAWTVPATVVEVPAARAIATCLKPAEGPDGRSVIVRLWETAGDAAPLSLRTTLPAMHTDLLERNLGRLPSQAGTVAVPIRALGLAGVRLGEG